MKTLINKHNPDIRITAPEITTAHPPVSNEGYVYWIPAINEMYNPIDWTLVEEKENISFADRLKKRLENMTQEEFEKAMNEIYVEGDESPTLEEYLKAAYHSPIETEPVDLEKEIEKKRRTILLDVFGLMNGEQCLAIKNFARHFYELGRKVRKEE